MEKSDNIDLRADKNGGSMKKSLLKAVTMMSFLLLLPFFFQNCAQPFEVSGGNSLLSTVGDTVSKTLSWDPSDDSSGNVDTSVTNYKVYVGKSADVYGSPVSVAVSTNPSLALDLEKGQTYYLAVTAVNSSGESPKATLTYTVPQ